MLFLSACSQAPLAGKQIATEKDDLYPLAIGNEWVYSDVDNLTKKVNADRIRRVTKKLQVAGMEFFEMEEATPDGDDLFRMGYRSDSEGVRYHNFDRMSHKDALNQILRYPVRTGDSWEVKVQLLAGGHKAVDKWNHTVFGLETVKVPAGTFRAVRIDSTDKLEDDPDDQRYWVRTWFAPAVGMVKYSTGRTNRAQDRTMELKRYKVSKAP